MQYALFYIDFFVNNIQKNHHLTALNGDFIIVCVTFLIMPFIGLSPFLLESPFIGYLSMILCQCPLSGFLHFYALNFIFDKKKKYSVNALYRAFSISTLSKIIKKHLLNRVNALYRAFSISTLPSGNALK